MHKYKSDSESENQQKIDSMIKIITRTDGYIGSANTKSTILLSLSSALFAATLLNYDKFLNRLVSIEDKYVLSLFAIISLGMLLISIFYSLKGVMPYLVPSSEENIFSFVDLRHSFKSSESYFKAISNKNSNETIKSLASLNFNLSGALLDKYHYHSKSIEAIVIALLCIGLMALIIILSNI